jgi:CheY-like chemotaxis protein
MARILIVDDSSFTRKALARMVKALGHEIVEASNGREGLELAAAQKPDCILVDLIMPEMGGMEVLEALRDQGSMIPRIVVTADIQESVREQCLKAGAVAVLNKPPKNDELKNALAKATDFQKVSDESDTQPN